MKRRSRQRQVRVAARIRKHLHLVVNSTKASIGGVCQRKIAVYKGVPRRTPTVQVGQASMIRGQRIPKLQQLAASILRGVWCRNPVMQMNLNLSPASIAMLCQSPYQAMIVLFGGIKIGVNEWIAVTITPCIGEPRTFPAPEIKAAFLLSIRSAQHPIFRHDRRLEVIR